MVLFSCTSRHSYSSSCLHALVQKGAHSSAVLKLRWPLVHSIRKHWPRTDPELAIIALTALNTGFRKAATHCFCCHRCFVLRKGTEQRPISWINTKRILKWNWNGVIFSAKPKVKVATGESGLSWLPMSSAGGTCCAQGPRMVADLLKNYQETQASIDRTSCPDPNHTQEEKTKGFHKLSLGPQGNNTELQEPA